MALFLAIDQSTSATKAILFDETAAAVDQVALPHQQIYPRPGWVEHDAGEIYANTLQAIRQVWMQNPDRVREVQSISITNQRETFVVWDSQTGEPLHHAIVWQCRRGDKFCARLTAEGYADEVHK